MTDSYTGVVDQIVDGTAVVLLESERKEREQLELDAAELPEAGRHEGAVLTVELHGKTVEQIEYRPETERERRERARKRFDRLSERLGEE